MFGELLLQHGDRRYEEVECAECGQKTKSNGRRTRTILHVEGQVEVKRTHRSCPECGQGIFSPWTAVFSCWSKVAGTPGR
ncbi:MAG: YgiT-type zinc finger protein [Caldilineaceae bacterium SB0665_bin_25]|nr:YgiT-type zinc finger protein [Caldilineaceae bacterium SB0665_bin_25]